MVCHQWCHLIIWYLRYVFINVATIVCYAHVSFLLKCLYSSNCIIVCNGEMIAFYAHWNLWIVVCLLGFSLLSTGFYFLLWCRGFLAKPKARSEGYVLQGKYVCFSSLGFVKVPVFCGTNKSITEEYKFEIPTEWCNCFFSHIDIVTFSSQRAEPSE